MGLFDTLLRPIEDLFNRIFGGTVVGRLVGKIRDGVQHTLTILDRSDNLAKSIIAEVRAFRNWKEDFQIKNKVINLPKAVERTRDLFNEVKTAWETVVELVKEAKHRISFDSVEEAETAAAEIESGGIGEGLLRRLPRVAKGLERLLGIVTAIVDILLVWSDIIDKAQLIVDTVRDLREEVETGSTIFLFQGNQRRTVKLADGTSMKIRVGNLHS